MRTWPDQSIVMAELALIVFGKSIETARTSAAESSSGRSIAFENSFVVFIVGRVRVLAVEVVADDSNEEKRPSTRSEGESEKVGKRNERMKEGGQFKRPQ